MIYLSLLLFIIVNLLINYGTVQNPIIAKTLGHKSSNATKVYSRMNIDPVKKGIEGAIELMN